MSPEWNGVEYSRKMIDDIKPKGEKTKGFDPHYIYEENEIKPIKEQVSYEININSFHMK